MFHQYCAIFIRHALDQVFLVCFALQDGTEADINYSAMGKSRSATVTCAFLMQRYGITPSQALAQIRETRPFCEPNDGFMKQLELYHRMAETDDIEGSPVYQRWLYQREIEMSRACGQAPEAEKIRFEDEHESQGTSDFELKCKKCRYDFCVTPRRLTIAYLTRLKTSSGYLAIPDLTRAAPRLIRREVIKHITGLRTLFPRCAILDASRARARQIGRPSRMPEMSRQRGQIRLAGHAMQLR